MVASDVAARGLDIPQVEHVIHYQTPKNSEVTTGQGLLLILTLLFICDIVDHHCIQCTCTLYLLAQCVCFRLCIFLFTSVSHLFRFMFIAVAVQLGARLKVRLLYLWPRRIYRATGISARH